MCEISEIDQATDLIHHFIHSLINEGILSHSINVPISLNQSLGSSFMELILTYGPLHPSLDSSLALILSWYSTIWECYLKSIEQNDYQVITALILLLHDKMDPSLDYFFGNILKYCLTHEWSVEIDFFTSLLESWTEFTQVEEMISLYRHCLQSKEEAFH